jgi:5'-nucleotidase
MSHAITMTRPLYLTKVEEEEGVEIYACSGTPVDCVKIAFDSLLLNKEMPALILSGINHGSNSAVNVLYSGTMAAAIEASFYNIPSIGLSLLDHSPDADFTTVNGYIPQLVETVLHKNPECPFCLNINFPNLPADQIKDIRPCRQTRGYWREEFERRQDPRGKDYYWLIGYFNNAEPEAEDTDEWALKHGYISVVPIQVDLTNYKQLGDLKDWSFTGRQKESGDTKSEPCPVPPSSKADFWE